MQRKIKTLRTRIRNEIVSEFLPPKRVSQKVIILCCGMPTYPGRRGYLLEFLARKGYWVFLPRYRGSWESDGSFLQKSPHNDIIDIIDQLPRGFIDLWNDKKYSVRRPEIYLIGSSFGGPAAILASQDTRVKKVVAISPVVDWRVKSKVEPLDWLARFTRIAFGQGYRFQDRDWEKLKSGSFYNPSTKTNSLDGRKLLLFHAKDDKVVPFRPTFEFSRKTGSAFIAFKKGGHLGIDYVMEPRFWKLISKFFNSKNYKLKTTNYKLL